MKNMLRCALLLSSACACGATAHGQQRTPQQMVASAVQTELAVDRDDHSMWIYRDHEVTPERDTVSIVAESPLGEVKRKIGDHGRPLTPEQAAQENARIESFVADSQKQQRVRRDAEHDDDQEDAMLRLLPMAFVWTVESDAGDLITLAFRPNPDFVPQTMEAKVLSSMAGRIVVTHAQNRIVLIEGRLTKEVSLAWGLARLHKGGTFHVERHEVAPRFWQVTDSHIHIDGRVLLFKTISQQEDEIKTDFRPSPARNIAEAAKFTQK